jgi:hypothetical protein
MNLKNTLKLNNKCIKNISIYKYLLLSSIQHLKEMI